VDNAFLGPLLSAFGRSFLSKRNRGKSTGKKNIHRMGFLLVAAWGFFIASIVALIIFIVDFSRGWLNSGGIIAFIAVLVFHIITLPVEFDASHRAIKQMEALNLVSSQDIAGSKKVLGAAAMTYIAAVAVAAANLLRVLVIRNRN